METLEKKNTVVVKSKVVNGTSIKLSKRDALKLAILKIRKGIILL